MTNAEVPHWDPRGVSTTHPSCIGFLTPCFGALVNSCCSNDSFSSHCMPPKTADRHMKLKRVDSVAAKNEMFLLGAGGDQNHTKKQSG